MIQTKNHVLIFFTVAVLGSLLYFYFDPSHNNIFPPCPFYMVTGLYCPGCGSQRAFHALLHGDILQSAHKNILFVIFLPLMIFSLLATVNNVFRKKKTDQRIFNSLLFAKVVLVIVLTFWVLRNIPAEPFSWLAP
jgi:hypothetical protein